MSGNQYLIGAKFNKLKILKIFREDNRTKVICQCDCGNETKTHLTNVKSGVTKSCGCYGTRVKHGGNNTYLQKVWAGIKQRCYNENCKRYKDYGARGIIIFETWINSFETFQDYILSEIGPRPSKDFTLDRKNNDGNYEPGNLQWSTYTEQNNNQRKRRE